MKDSPVVWLTGSVFLAAAAYLVAAGAKEPEVRVVEVKTIETRTEVVPIAVPMPTIVKTHDVARASEVNLVFAADGVTYMKLTDVGEREVGGVSEVMPRHGKPKLVSDESGSQTSIATVELVDLPLAYRLWLDRSVLVDGSIDGSVGGPCNARVSGFAVVSRLNGSTGYAGEDAANGWTAKNVLANGSVMIAARLSGCADGVYGRDAEQPAIAKFETSIVDGETAAAARTLIMRSDAARATAKTWTEIPSTGLWYEHATFDMKLLRHPKTGAKLVATHAHAEHGCGDPGANIFGLFEVNGDGSLKTLTLRDLGDVETIESFIDLEGDGTVELVGKPWLGLDRVIVRAGTGEELQRLPESFFGCPC